MTLRGVGPALDIDHPRQVPLAIDQEDRPHAVTEPMKTLDRGQAGGEGGRSRQVPVSRRSRIVLGAEQECSGRHAAVFVGRERGHTQRLERRRNAVGTDCIEIVRDDQVFRLVLKPVETTREFRVEQPPKSEVDRFHDHLDQVALRRQQRRRVAWLKREMSSQPLDLDSQPIGVFVEPVIGLVRRTVPVNDAAITGRFELRIREEVLEGAPEHHLVEAHDPGNRHVGTVDSHWQTLAPKDCGLIFWISNVFLVEFGDFSLARYGSRFKGKANSRR